MDYIKIINIAIPLTAILLALPVMYLSNLIPLRSVIYLSLLFPLFPIAFFTYLFVRDPISRGSYFLMLLSTAYILINNMVIAGSSYPHVIVFYNLFIGLLSSGFPYFLEMSGRNRKRALLEAALITLFIVTFTSSFHYSEGIPMTDLHMFILLFLPSLILCTAFLLSTIPALKADARDKINVKLRVRYENQ